MPVDVNLLTAPPSAAGRPPGKAREDLKTLLAGDDAFATTMLVLAIEAFGMECLSDAEDPGRGPWHPDAFLAGLESEYGVRPSAVHMDRLMAAASVLTSDSFFKQASAFVPLANVLAGSEFDPESFDPADPVECAWAITEALILRPPDDDEPELFSQEVRRYVGETLKTHGYADPPDVLRIALGVKPSETLHGLDPEARAAQAEKTAEVETTIRENLSELADQLESLPLEHGTAAEIVARLRQAAERKQG